MPTRENIFISQKSLVSKLPLIFKRTLFIAAMPLAFTARIIGPAYAIEIQSSPPTVQNGLVNEAVMKSVSENVRNWGKRNPNAPRVLFKNCSFEPASWNALFKEQESIHNLALYDCQLGGSDLEAISKANSLSSLEFGGAQVTDQTLQVLSGLCSLEFLSCINTKVRGSGLKVLCSPQKLHSLVLFNNDISVKELSNLKELSTLTDLSIVESKITARRFLELPRFPNLKTF